MNIVRYIMRNYYLSKICEESITKEEVADIYSTTIENVEKAVHEYKDTKNPFKKMDRQTKQGYLQILISFVSAMLVLFTLFEMQAERNAAYMPNISINSPGIKFAWNQDRILAKDISGIMDEKKDIWEAYGSSYAQGLIVKMNVQNTGVGVAKDVCVDWLHVENIPSFQKAFSGNNDISVYVEKNQLIIDIKDGMTMGSFFPESERLEFGFLSADLTNSQELVIPDEYIHLYELLYAYQLWDNIPDIRFNVIYKDVQGEIYTKTFVIHPQPEMVIMAPENQGFGIVNLSIKEQKTEHFSVFGKYRNAVLFGTICFILVFAVLFILAVRFEMKRRRNKAASEKQTQQLKPELVSEDIHKHKDEKNVE